MDKKRILKKISEKNTTSLRTVRNKELTKRLFIDAAAKIIKTEGFKALGVTNVAKHANRSKRMIYEYFGSIQGLVRALLNKRDFTVNYDEGLDHLLQINQKDHGKDLTIYILKHYFEQFKQDVILQEVSLKELTSPTDFLKEIAIDREKYGEKLFSLVTEYFQDTGVHAHSLIQILYASINFLVLHGQKTDVPFIGFELKNLDHQNNLVETLELLVELVYKHVESKKNMNDDESQVS